MTVFRIQRLGIIFLLLALASGGSAQDRSVVKLVPTSGWQLIKTQPLALSALGGFGGDPVVEREYGVKNLKLRHYQHAAQIAEALFEEASDPVSAYGLLTFYRTEELTPEKGLDMAFIGPSAALMARGRVFIRVRPAPGSDITRRDFRTLLIAIEGSQVSLDESAAYPAPLPADGLLPHTEKYLLGLETARRVLPDFRTDLIGFNQGAEVRVGAYSTRTGRSTVLLMNYPTPQIARVRFGAMENLLGINHEKSPGSIYGKRSGSFVFLVLNSSSAGAEELLKQFRVTSDISWNEPAPEGAKFARDFVQLILAIFMLVFAIASAAVIGGVSVVLSRRVAKRFFPDSAWANPDRETVIRLNLQ